AAGNVDLTGGPLTYLNQTGLVTTDTPANCRSGGQCAQQLGGVAVYTAGHRVAAFTKTLTDPVTGVPVTFSMPAPKASNLRSSGFTYAALGTAGVLVADPVYLTDGGDITVKAQGDVLSRRDMSLANLRANSGNGSFLPLAWSGYTDATSTALKQERPSSLGAW